MGKLVDQYIAAQQRRRASRRRSESPDQRKFYGSRVWRLTSERIRRERPVCEKCHAAPSQMVDHVDGCYWNNPSDGSNYQALCRPCERTRTGRQHAAKSLGKGAGPAASSQPESRRWFIA